MDNHLEFKVDDGEMKITSNMAPMLMRCIKNDRDNYRNIPAIEGEGQSIAFGTNGEYPLRIMFWAGLESGVSDQYPIASTTKLSVNGNILFPLTWKWPEISALYFDEIIKWYKRRLKAEFSLDMTPSAFMLFDFKMKYLFENNPALFEEVVIRISNRLFGPGKFKGWSG